MWTANILNNKAPIFEYHADEQLQFLVQYIHLSSFSLIKLTDAEYLFQPAWKELDNWHVCKKFQKLDLTHWIRIENWYQTQNLKNVCFTLVFLDELWSKKGYKNNNLCNVIE